MKVWLKVAIAFLLLLLTVSTVSAHAKLVKASPAPNSVLGSAPSQVQLWFDETVDLNFSQVQVLDQKRQRVDTGELLPASDDPKSVIVPLKPSGDGTYNVIWKVLSATDGHLTSGVFAYGVGTTAGVVPVPTSPEVTAPTELSPISAMVRWVSLISLLALIGGSIFRFFVLEPSLDFVNASKNTRRVASTRWLQLITFALVLFFVSSVGELFLETSLVTGQVTFTAIFQILTNTRAGLLWLMRLGLIAVCAVLVGLEARRVRVPFADYALIVPGAVALFTRSLGSHSAWQGNFTLPVLSDWLHLLGVSIWVGGLFSIAWLVPFIWRSLDPKSRSAWIAWLVPKFSWIALPTTILIAITGLYNSTLQIPALDILNTRTLPTVAQLTQNTYADALLLKVALFAVMLCFGALNLLLISPRFRRFVTQPEQSAGMFSRFRLTVGAEVLLGLGAIFLAGILTLSPPPRSEPDQLAPAIAQEPQLRAVNLIGYPSSAVKVQLQIGPKPTAPTEFTATVTTKDGQPLTDLQRVIFQFMYLNQDTGAQNITADAKADNQYVAQGNYLSLDGMWKIRVTVRRKGLDDVAVEFPYYIAPSVAENNTTVANAQVQLMQAQQSMNKLTSLHSTQELNDGVNGVVISDYQYQAPDKTEFKIEGQGASIAIGAQQYYQDKNGQWSERPRVENFVFPNFDFANTAQATRLGRADQVDGKPAQIILFDTPNTSGTDLIHYAYWVGTDDNRVLKFGMVTTDHYMMQYYDDFNGSDIVITAPPNVAIAPTPAPVAETSSGPLTAAVQGTGRPKGFITGDLEGDGALVLVVAGVISLLIGTGGKRTRHARVVTMGLGVAGVLLGIGLFIDAVNGTQAAAANVPVNTARASSGQQIYDQNCAVCHGPKGYGDGPGGAALPVKPFDLTTHVLLHDEQYLYATILNGRGYMPAFGNRLTQDQILDVIAYTRLLARQAQQNTARPGFTPQP